MKKLNFEQMEVISGGGRAAQNLGCAMSIIALVGGTIGVIGLTAATGGLAVGAAIVTFTLAPSAAAISCMHLKRN
jgi:hypothetical protein